MFFSKKGKLNTDLIPYQTSFERQGGKWFKLVSDPKAGLELEHPSRQLSTKKQQPDIFQHWSFLSHLDID